MSVKAVTRRGKPVWRVQVIREGGKFNRRRFLDRRTFLKHDALDVEAELIAEYEASQRRAELDRYARRATPESVVEYPPASRLETAQTGALPTFGTFAEQYLAVQDPGRSDFKNKARAIRQHLIPFFGVTPLDQVSRLMIDRFKIKLRTPTAERAAPRRGSDPTPITSRRKGGAKSPKTINNLLTILRSILNLAHDYELIDRVPRIKMEVIKRQDAGFLDDREVEAFLRAAPPEWRPFLLTAIRTGLRRGELLELRWRDLHLDAPRPFVRVSRALRRTDKGGWAVKETKGGRPRSVPLSGEVIAALEQHRRDAGPHDLVFPGESGGYINRNKLWRMVVKTARKGGLDKHVHPHLLRHTFASHCYQRGIPPRSSSSGSVTRVSRRPSGTRISLRTRGRS